MLMKLLNWLRGYLYVRIGGIDPERFINLCINKKIFIWNLKKAEDSYQFYILRKNYKKLKPIARKTKIIPRITRKNGLPFLLHRYHNRKGFFAGFLVCAVLIYILSLFIWDISVLGGSKYTPETITKFLKESNVYTGILKKKVDCQEIEETIRLTYKDIGWVSAEMKGTRLILKITETNMPAPAINAMEPSHIVATKDAIIKSIITRTGTPMVREGDVVHKGDVLVSGVNNIMADFDIVLRKEPVVADADIKCKTFYDYYEKIPLNYLNKQYTQEEKKGYFISLFGKKLFLYNPRNSYLKYDIIVNEKTLHITPSFYLPFRYGSIITKEFEEIKQKYSEIEAVSVAESHLNRYFENLKKNHVIITENNVKITVENNYCIAQGRIMVEEPAWEYKTVQENEWRIEPVDEHSGDNH